jgi:hypothetical protein
LFPSLFLRKRRKKGRGGRKKDNFIPLFLYNFCFSFFSSLKKGEIVSQNKDEIRKMKKRKQEKQEENLEKSEKKWGKKETKKKVGKKRKQKEGMKGGEGLPESEVFF